MGHLIATLVLAVLTFAPLQDGSKSEGQSNKANAARHDAQRKKKVPPPTAPVSSERKIDQPTLQYNQANTEQPAKPEHRLFHNVIDILNALSTVVIATFTATMWRAIHNQNRAFRIAERAWLVPEIQFPPQQSEDGQIELLNHFLNKGRTPAWVTGMGSRGQILRPEDELPPEPTYTLAGPFPPEGNVLPPKAFTRQGLPLSPQQWASIERGEAVFYFFGFVTYRDIFGADHETRYCFRFKPGPTPTDPAPRDFYVAGPRAYNRAT
jgi:hypothetical protein